MVEKRKASLSQIFRGNNHFLIDLVCPDNTSINRSHSIRDTVADVLQDSCKELGIKRADIFGVALHEYNEYRFISDKKALYKFLPSEAILPYDQRSSIDETCTKKFTINNAIKTCRLYLRVRIFLPNVDSLNGRSLYFYYEQARLDSLRYQNWLQFSGLTEIYHNIGAIAIWLKYGESSLEGIENRTMHLNMYLPINEQNDNTWCMLKKRLQDLNTEYGYHDYRVNTPVIKESLITKLPLSKSDSNQSAISVTRMRKDTVTEDDVVIVDDRDTIMVKLINEAKRLPFYGVHFYHVSMQKDEDSKNLTNCKLGLGPVGITVVVSPFYTTWRESLSLGWSSIEEMKYDRNILYITEKSRGKGKKLKSNESASSLSHQFICVNEKEAKYLFDQLRDYHFIQTTIQQERKADRTKRNSIGILNAPPVTKDNKLSASPIPRRSLSFNLLLFPRKYST
uniref:FERM domain-containing protein n=1 Tax=Clytia hemisphaerica TaxID=252671 RepID=A0A7M6DR16_9CNID|eukprot:TCONS_00025412-protein